MTAKKFIYFSRSASETSLQTSSTASNAVGSNTVLIAVAENGTVDASFYVFGGSGGLKISETNISDDSISTPKLQANSVTANEILSNTITANEIASNTITASEINTGTITIGSLSGAGDLAEQNSVNWSTQVSGTGKPENYADKTTATVIGTAMDGTAVITTGIIKDSAENMVIDFDAATITVGTSDGLVIDGSGNMRINDSEGYGSEFSALWAYKAYYGGSLHQTQIESQATASQFNLTNYTYLGTLGGLVGIGGEMNTAHRLNVAASTTYDTFSYAARFNGDVTMTDDLDVGGDIDVDGIILCTAIYGDGSNLTGISNYTHPNYSGDDFSVDTGALSGATVVSDIDINVTTDSLGHVTDANGTVSTRNLSLSDLGYTGATNADRYYDWNLYVDGSFKKSVCSGNDVKFTGGTNIELSYSSDTITIGLTTYPEFASAFVGSSIYHDGDTDTRITFAPDNIYLMAGDVKMLELSESTINKAIFGCIVEPQVDSSFNLGYTTKAWKNIYGDAIYRNGSALDVYDDLYELSQVKSKKEKNEFGEKIEVEKLNAKGLPVIDPLSIPQELTNYDDVVATLKHDNCDLITQADIDEYILDDEEAGWMLKTDFTLLSDLTMGAVRQLDSEVISMFELLSSRITALENGTKAKGA
jgi:hypothetical protein